MAGGVSGTGGVLWPFLMGVGFSHRRIRWIRSKTTVFSCFRSYDLQHVLPCGSDCSPQNRKDPQEAYYPSSHYPLIMMKSGTTLVEDTEENRQICRKTCRACPTYKHNSLERYQPDALFCACGTSSAPSKKELNCYCPACELWTKHSLVIGHFCAQR